MTGRDCSWRGDNPAARSAVSWLHGQAIHNPALLQEPAVGVCSLHGYGCHQHLSSHHWLENKCLFPLLCEEHD